MNSKDKRFFWIDSTYTRYFLIPENQNIPPGDFLLFNLTGKKKKVALTAISSFEITEEEANTYFENELNHLLEKIEISEDNLEEILKMVEEIFSESSIEKCLPDFVNKLGKIEGKIEDNPELLAQVVYEFYTSLSQDFFSERKKLLEEKRQQEYKKSAEEAVEKALSSFTIPSFAEKDWMPGIDFLVDKDEQK